jgi:hypothetical protein
VGYKLWKEIDEKVAEESDGLGVFKGKDALKDEIYGLVPNNKEREFMYCRMAVKQRVPSMDASLLSEKLL